MTASRSARTVAVAANDGVPASERSAVVDNARAIGILLVVLGHAPAIAPWLSDTIFAFHMPLFFFLSGAVVAPQRLGHPLGRRAAELARSLLLPYLFFFTIAWAYWLLAKRHGLRSSEFQALPWWDPVGGLLIGTGDALYVDPALWFFPCLFVTAVAYHALRKRLSSRVAFAVCAVAAYALVVLRPVGAVALPWSVDCAIVGLAFYAAGPLLRETAVRPPHGIVAHIVRACIAALGLAMCLSVPSYTGHVDLSRLVFGTVPSLYLPVAASGTAAVLALAALLGPSRVARWLSANTLVIFPLHMLFFSGVTGAAILVFRQPETFKYSVEWIAAPYVVAALAASWVASFALHRYAPWLFGRRRVRIGTDLQNVQLASVQRTLDGR